jgi:hypothetical protein
MTAFRPSQVIAVAALLMTSADVHVLGDASAATKDEGTRTIQVTGSGVDLLTTAVVHSKEFTASGLIQQSTQIVELNGDLKGRVLYHVTTVIDFVQGTLVNTGEQVYSGTIAGSAPVMIHDDQFRFEVNLATGEEHGRVYLFNHIAGPKVRCTLEGIGKGMSAEGNPLFDYKGTCTFRGQ